MSGPRYYEEPPQTIIHLYEQRDDECWYLKEFIHVPADSEELAEAYTWEFNQKANCLHIAADKEKKERDLKTEHRRMKVAFEAILKIAEDMCDPVRRAGPTGGQK